jgi:hypothetical protein
MKYILFAGFLVCYIQNLKVAHIQPDSSNSSAKTTLVTATNWNLFLIFLK